MWTCSLRARRAESFSPGLRENGTAGLHAVGPDGLVAFARVRHNGASAVSIAPAQEVFLPPTSGSVFTPNARQMPRKSADMDTCNARESFHSASTDTALAPRSTWLM